MTLWFRLIWYFLAFWRKQAITSTRETGALVFRVLPTDIDLNGHMTNARYFSVADLGRIDLIMRAGLGRLAYKRKWVPVVIGASAMFRHELRLGARYQVVSGLRYWDERVNVFEHRFEAHSGLNAGKTAAIVLSAAYLYDRKMKQFVPSQLMLDELGFDEVSPELTPEIETFIEGLGLCGGGIDSPGLQAENQDLLRRGTHGMFSQEH